MNRYYDLRAPYHDYYMSFKSHEQHKELMAPVIAIVEPLIKNRNVLEIACGTGIWTATLADFAQKVTAADISPAALKIAAEKLAEYNNIELIADDAYSLENTGRGFAAAFSSDWFSHIPRKSIAGFIKNLESRLTPGAPVIFLDMSHRPIFDEDPFEYDSHGNRVSRRSLPDGTEFDIIKNFFTEAEIKGIFVEFDRTIEYYAFDELKRWMVIYRIPD